MSAHAVKNITLVTIIVNYRAGQLICDGLEELVARHRAIGGFRIYIVDNHSANGDVERLRRKIAQDRFGDDICLIAHPYNDGFGSGNNVALKKLAADGLRPDHVFFLNPDATPLQGCLAHLQGFLADNPDAGIAGAQLETINGEVQASGFRFFSIAGEFESTVRTGPVSKLLSGAIIALPQMMENTKTDWVSGAAFMARAEMLDDIGGFDEGFFLYFEETDLMRRARASGWEVWHIPGARAVHLEGFSTGVKGIDGAKRVADYWYRSRNLYFQNNHSLPVQIFADLAWLCGTALYGMRCLVTGKPGAGQWRKLVDFLRNWRQTGRG